MDSENKHDFRTKNLMPQCTRSLSFPTFWKNSRILEPRYIEQDHISFFLKMKLRFLHKVIFTKSFELRIDISFSEDILTI